MAHPLPFLPLATIAALILLELGLRQFFGFGQPLVYLADPDIGYLLAPNQKTRRFGKTIHINQYSMRSADFAPQRPRATWRILLLGDSIANGGWWTDQTETISAQLQQQLSPQIAAPFDRVEVLNASANSWGPRNELAYLKRFGDFGAQAVVLIINTDDLFAITPNSWQVGRDRNYPTQRPPLAMAEVVQRYLWKSGPIPELEALYQEGGDRVGVNLAAIAEMAAIVTQGGGRFFLVITPLLREVGAPGSRDYEVKARQRLQDFAQEKQIPLTDFLTTLNQLTDAKKLYHDHIHLNRQGNAQLVETIMPVITASFP